MPTNVNNAAQNTRALPPGGSLATTPAGSMRVWRNTVTGQNVTQVYNGSSWVTIQEEEEMENDFTISYKVFSVNSKRLLNEIKTLIEEIGEEYISLSHLFTSGLYDYSELVRFLDMYFEDLLEKKTITQYDIVADHRNNTPADLKLGAINIHMSFRQTHCVNLSRINVQFTPVPQKSR